MRFVPGMTPEALCDLLNQRDAEMDAIKARNAELTEQLLRKHASETGASNHFAKYAVQDRLKGTLGDTGVRGGILLRGYDVDETGRPCHPRWDSDGPQALARCWGYLDDPSATDELQVEIQNLYAARQLVRMRQKAAGQEPHTPMFDWKVRHLLERAPEAIQKAFVDTNGVGGEWIPVDTFAGVERALELLYQRSVPGLFAEFPVSRNITVPTYLNAPVPYLFGVTGDDPAKIKSSDITSGSVSTALKTLAARLQAGEDDLEESIVPNSAGMLMDALAYAIATAEEDAIINGDTTATHGDTGIASWNPNLIYSATPGGTSLDHRRAWVGLRHRAIAVSNTIDRSTFSYATLMADRAAVVGPKPPGGLALIGSEQGLAKNVYSLDQFATSEKFPSNPTNLNGTIGRYALGCDIVESRLMTDDLNTAGIHDHSTMTKTGILLVVKAGFRRFVRYGVRVEAVREPQSGLIHFVVRRRMDFRTTNAAATKNVRYEYNVAPA